MNNRGRLVLVVLFFGGLTALWVADWLQIPTSEERLARLSRVLPDLDKVTVPDVTRVEISGGAETIVLKREGRDWRLIEPVNARADGSTVDLLITALKDLRKPPDSEPLKGEPGSFGLEPPERVVKLFVGKAEEPVAVLELGKKFSTDRYRYVRAKGAKSPEVAETVLIEAVDLPVNGWRDRLLFDVASYGVTGFEVTGEKRSLAAERRDQAWTLTDPIQAPAEPLKIEGLLGGLTSLRVVEGEEGYAENDAADLTRYGLEKPAWKILLKTGAGSQTVEIGNALPGDKGEYYARRVPENDVVVVRGQVLLELEADPHTLRSKQVTQLNPSRVDYLTIKAGDLEHRMARTQEGWKLESPVKAGADAQRIENLIALLNGI
ncbi:MAG TPA: DUF4340 domain-containing protein, partial [Isosphaeraceae bacterium]|nr:DUF4340 domain-containing protein [Isosphaeraceae bacterium]